MRETWAWRCVFSTTCPFSTTFNSVYHSGPSETSSEVTKPNTGRRMSQIWFDKAQNSRVRPRQGTRERRPGCSLSRQRSPVCATNPNEASLCGGTEVLSVGICLMSYATKERCSEETSLSYMHTHKMKDWWGEVREMTLCRPKNGNRLRMGPVKEWKYSQTTYVV